MLTCEQLENIARILGWTISEVEGSIAELNSGFLNPDVEYFDFDPDAIDDGDPEPGFYFRLSAPGYMDCTDWSGPFATEDDAVAEMLSMHCDF